MDRMFTRAPSVFYAAVVTSAKNITDEYNRGYFSRSSLLGIYDIALQYHDKYSSSDPETTQLSILLPLSHLPEDTRRNFSKDWTSVRLFSVSVQTDMLQLVSEGSHLGLVIVRFEGFAVLAFCSPFSKITAAEVRGIVKDAYSK
ncbi:Hypothetical protein GLP15_41 [Giardia lamblia P15]|uniref:Uncharacterized protein n=1 Tax=Giardia intestinalis (strain P15) TaxID=658858 RepID=E1F0Q5_GIAIA|nr:Hypothetical protein GLP15_41 [Giardia lamblia P15]